jgi:hypothetical protein
LDHYKVNFFLLHAINSLVLWPSLVHHPWLCLSNSIRLLEWQGRYFLTVYAAEACPKISTEDLAEYVKPLESWDQLFQKCIAHSTDDGHLPKVIRALAFGESTWKTLSSQSNRLMKEDMWLKLANRGKFHPLQKALAMGELDPSRPFTDDRSYGCCPGG